MDFRSQIKVEFEKAEQARGLGNEGQARVCARRAAGQALTWLLSEHPKKGWSSVAIDQLKMLRDDESFPLHVREAGARLTTKISEQFAYRFSADPIDDATIIIDYVKSVLKRNAG